MGLLDSSEVSAAAATIGTDSEALHARLRASITPLEIEEEVQDIEPDKRRSAQRAFALLRSAGAKRRQQQQQSLEREKSKRRWSEKFQVEASSGRLSKADASASKRSRLRTDSESTE